MKEPEKTSPVRIVNRKHTNSIKWDYMSVVGGTEEDLPFWIADMDYAVYEGVNEALRKAAGRRAPGYTVVDSSYQKAMCGWFERMHGITFDPGWVVSCLNVLGSMQIVVNTLLQEGDGVMLFTPAYPNFCDIIANRNLKRNEAEVFTGQDINWKAVEKQIRASKAVIFCNPHNPIAKVWKEEELARFAALCAKYEVWVLSDDVHCDMAMFGNRYICLTKYEEIREKLIVFTSAAKSFNLAGLAGCNLVIPGEALRERIKKQLQIFSQTNLTIFTAAGIKAAYEGADDWNRSVKAYMEENVRYVLHCLEKDMPKIRCIHEGTFLMWLDCRQLHIGGEELNRKLREKHLIIDNGVRYGNAGDGFLRMNIACSRNMLKAAMKRFRDIYNEITVKGEEK